MKYKYKYECPNGLPPEECGHIPQLIINVLSSLRGLLQEDGARHADVGCSSVPQPTGKQVRRKGRD